MPVFSRRLCKKALFLGVNLAVQVAAAKAGLLQPRPGAVPESMLEQDTVCQQRVERREWNRQARERLQSASTAVGLARLQLRIGSYGDAAATLERLHEEIQSLRRQLEGKRRPAPRQLPRGDRRTAGELLAGCPD
jgi:hypothetical protein